jgi:hypothetical protein
MAWWIALLAAIEQAQGTDGDWRQTQIALAWQCAEGKIKSYGEIYEQDGSQWRAAGKICQLPQKFWVKIKEDDDVSELVMFDGVAVEPQLFVPDLRNWFKEIGVKVVPSNKGGRPPKFNYDGFWIELCLKIRDPAVYFTERELVRHMIDWAAQYWEKPPSEQTIREKVKKLITQLGQP